MELVPIVYTALIIVAILAVVTIIISFISYKVRQRYGLVDTPTIAQPAIKVEESVKRVVNRLTKPIEYNIPKEKNVVKREKEPLPVNKSSNVPPKPKKNSKPEKENSDRLEVVKNLTPPKVDLPQVEAKKVEPAPVPKIFTKENDAKLKTLGDKIIDKYDDENDEDMFTLKIKKNTKKDN